MNQHLTVINNVSKKTSISKEVVSEIYNLYFEYISNKIHSYDFTQCKTEEDFLNKFRGFNLEHIGKIHFNFNYINRRNNKKREI